MRTPFGSFGVARSSRIARRYAMPATPKGIMKEGSPVRLKLRAQIVSATSNVTQRTQRLREGVTLKMLQKTDPGLEALLPRRRTMRRFAAPWPERVASLALSESDRLRHRCRRRVPSGQSRVQGPWFGPADSRARWLFPCHRLQRAMDERLWRPPDSSRHRGLALQPRHG